MNRVQFGLLLLLGVILLGGAAFWIFDRTPDLNLTTSKLATVSEGPVQITEITRRRPNMLIISGKAPAEAQLTLRLSGNKIGNTKADESGAFQLTTNPLPRDEDLFLTLDYGADTSIGLLLVDRRPQLISFVKPGDYYLPLQRPSKGEGALVYDPGETNIHIIGQANAGSSAYLYSGNLLIGKATTPTNGDATRLFDIMIKPDAVKEDLRIDIYNALGTLTARSNIDINDTNAWQQINEPGSKQPLYVWRDLSVQQDDIEQIYPGQFIPAATTTPAQ